MVGKNMTINLKRKIVRCEMFAEYNRRLYRKTQELEEVLQNIEPEYINLSAETTKTLTKREKEILKCLCEGKSNPQIAEELVVTLSTVKAHVSSIIRKLNAGDRTQAVYIAKSKNLL